MRGFQLEPTFSLALQLSLHLPPARDSVGCVGLLNPFPSQPVSQLTRSDSNDLRLGRCNNASSRSISDARVAKSSSRVIRFILPIVDFITRLTAIGGQLRYLLLKVFLVPIDVWRAAEKRSCVPCNSVSHSAS